MFFNLDLAVFLILATSSAHAAQHPCLCAGLLLGGLKVNCSTLSLTKLPPLPLDTTELYVQDNWLTSVSPGKFDKLVSLKKVSLSGNPFHCDCSIQYLRNWLLKNRAIVLKEPTCISPSFVADKAISELSDDYFSSCVRKICTDGATYNIIMGLMSICVIVLLLFSFRLARRSTFVLYINERPVGFKANDLKPKHRRRLHTVMSEVSVDLEGHTYTEDLESPLVNMELLPQVLDVLHKKHNIKIKAT